VASGEGVRVLIVDDHAVVRKGVGTLLAATKGVEVCGEAVNGRDGIAKARELKPDVVLMDITMPDMNGIEATKEIVATRPDVRVVILSQHNAPQLIEESLKAGAAGYVVKSSIWRDLPAILRKLGLDGAGTLAKAANGGSEPTGSAAR
jgi:DNA-binding NarL/FixJ family response regulator